MPETLPHPQKWSAFTSFVIITPFLYVKLVSGTHYLEHPVFPGLAELLRVEKEVGRQEDDPCPES